MKLLNAIGHVIGWLGWWLLMPLAALCADQFGKDFREYIDLKYPRNWGQY